MKVARADKLPWGCAVTRRCWCITDCIFSSLGSKMRHKRLRVSFIHEMHTGVPEPHAAQGVFHSRWPGLKKSVRKGFCKEATKAIDAVLQLT